LTPLAGEELGQQALRRERLKGANGQVVTAIGGAFLRCNAKNRNMLIMQILSEGGIMSPRWRIGIFVGALLLGFVGGILGTLIFGYGGKIASLEEKDQAVVAQLSDANDMLSALSSRLDSLENSLAAFKTHLNESGDALASLNDLVNSVQTQLETFQSDLAVRLGNLEPRLDSVESSISSLEGKLATLPKKPRLKVAYVDTESLFIKVFLPQVEAQRQVVSQKQEEIRNLQDRYLEGELTQEEYQQQMAKLQVELLQAQLDVDFTMLAKMIVSPAFVNSRSDLERLREKLQPVMDEVRSLLQATQLGIADMEGFTAQYRQLQSAFQQLDQLLTQAAAAKIVEIAQQVGKEQGYDLILGKKDVLIYHNEEAVADISGDVEARLWSLFSS